VIEICPQYTLFTDLQVNITSISGPENCGVSEVYGGRIRVLRGQALFNSIPYLDQHMYKGIERLIARDP